MLEVVLYQSNQDMFGQLSSDPTQQIICPSPLIADNMRLVLPNSDITTISKWITDHLKKNGEVKTRKADLMLSLAAVWRHYFPALPVSAFREAFELFTELRSYTLELELLSEFFKELSEEMVKSILIFWTYLDQEKKIDEHFSYLKVASANHDRTLSFVGFKHMSGVQIDMLRQISEKQAVSVYFPKQVFSEALASDWIKWLEPNDDQVALENVEKPPLRVIIPPKGKANSMLSSFVVHNKHDLFIATTTPSFLNVQEIHSNGSFFKTTEDFFSVPIEQCFQWLKLLLESHNYQLNFAAIVPELQKYRDDLLKAGDYRSLKVIELMESALERYSQLQESIDKFAFEIVKEIVSLNAPRTSIVSLEKNIERAVSDINGLNFRLTNKPLAIIAINGSNNFRSSDKVLSEAMTKALRSIGPIKRAGLDYLFYKMDIISSLKEQAAVLFLDKELLESDLSWKEILKLFEPTLETGHVEDGEKERLDLFVNKMKPGPFVRASFSATSLQTYIDCPRKYYFSYINKLENRPKLGNVLSPEELGRLEHAVIAEYFTRSKKLAELDRSLHTVISRELFNKFLNDNFLQLNSTDKSKTYHEVVHYSLNGILFLLEFAQSHKALEISFEIPLGVNEWTLKGSIDCVVKLPDAQIAIFDFKRSSAASGSKNETLEFKKIQLWVYLLVLIERGEKIHSFGYINLSDLEDDKLIFSESESASIINNSYENLKLYISSTITNVNSCEKFYPNPRDSKVCHFCPITLFCHKAGLA